MEDPRTRAPERACPKWLLDHLAPTVRFIGGLTPFPFDQPADLQGYLSLHQNDYLRLSSHPRVVAARRIANERPRADSFSSAVFGGISEEHVRFETRLKQSVQAEEVLLTTSGWAANVGLLAALAPDNVPIYIDVDAHASLHDGVRFSAGRAVIIRHNEPEHLRKRLAIHGPGIVCIDALYSGDGSLADLESYVAICSEFDCVLVVDEAHSFGMFGALGGGLVVERRLADKVHFRTISLSKALGGHGGVVVGKSEAMLAVRALSRPVLFSSATAAVLAAGHDAALAEVMQHPELGRECLRLAARLRDGLRALGVDTCGSQSQIISIFFEQERHACEFYAELRKRRILTSVFVYPAVPLGSSLARFSVYAGLTDRDIDYVVDACARVLPRIPHRKLA